MSKIRTLTKRRAVSPVIATVILVAVTITVAVAVSYWMSNITGQYTNFEKIEMQSSYAQKFDTYDPDSPLVDASKGWRITLQLQNTGTGEATLMDCFINDMPLEHYGTDITWSYDTTVETTIDEEPMTSEGLTLLSGVKQILYVDILQGDYDGTAGTWSDSTVTFTSGTTINVKIHSAAGMDYIRLVRLP